MIYAILDNTIILLLTVLGFFHSRLPVFFVMAGAAIMIFVTYQSLEEEKNKKAAVFGMVFMMGFSVLSGTFAGFLVFFFCRNIKAWIRGCIGTSLFLLAEAAVYRNPSHAMSLLLSFFLVIAYLLLTALYGVIAYMENRKKDDNQKLIASNVSALHEKRLNEQLVMQTFISERNARLTERENISRNIHNSVGHSITAAIMTLDAADLLYDVKPDEARKKMNVANDRMRGSLEAIRRAVRILDEDQRALIAGELKSEFDMIIAEFVMDTSIEICQNYSELRDDIQIPHDHAIFLTGVLKEMLTNGVKHGNASAFAVLLLGDSAHIRLEISDNGQSDFAACNRQQRIESGFGLKKILSYAERCGGKAKFENENGFGSMVELPITLEA